MSEMQEAQESPETHETSETLNAPQPSHNQPANGFKNVAVEGSNNVAPVLDDTIGIIFLGITSLFLLFEVRRLTNLLLKVGGKGEGCSCDCCKDGKKAG
jgi:hypothetical protein